jgi:hypothetical protein
LESKKLAAMAGLTGHRPAATAIAIPATFNIRYIADDYDVILAETQPTTNKFPAHSLAGRTRSPLKPVLRIFDSSYP